MIEAVIQMLLADPLVQSLVGKNKADDKYKVYPVVCAQPEQHPYIVLRLTDKQARQCKGVVARDFAVSFDVYCFAQTYTKVDQIDRAVYSTLSGQREEYNGVTIQNIQFNTSRDGFLVEYADGLYVRISSYEAVAHENPITT